jgi:hypothetical protein
MISMLRFCHKTRRRVEHGAALSSDILSVTEPSTLASKYIACAMSFPFFFPFPGVSVLSLREWFIVLSVSYLGHLFVSLFSHSRYFKSQFRGIQVCVIIFWVLNDYLCDADVEMLILHRQWY